MRTRNDSVKDSSKGHMAISNLQWDNFRAAIATQSALKIISGLTNLNRQNVLDVVTAAQQGGATFVDISADTVLDEVTGEAYFRVSVEVDQEQLAQLEEILDIQLTLAPGMPADILLVTGDRTLLQYLWEPLGDSVNQAFREE